MEVGEKGLSLGHISTPNGFGFAIIDAVVVVN